MADGASGEPCPECTEPVGPGDEAATDDTDRRFHRSCLDERYDRERWADEQPEEGEQDA